ncbi:hypothetical protein BN1723_004125 [Verticillium longisporum]|uniref:Uncharacterized protein n=1 Tax=Verticillium longisporum TaxID=100787 RepID=A0A0G4MMT2_VERLO|nr:hypothetical protein BN1723_004125 [Verticillium longisporum]
MDIIALLAIAAIPTVIGTGQAISAQKRENEAQKEKVKFGIGADLTIDGHMEEASGVLIDGQMFLDHSKSPVKGFPFSGWYFMYPGEEQHMGLVSMTSNDPPAMGWIFVDADTRAVRFGGRKDTVDHVIGPWHWTPNEKYVSLRGSGDGFAAVRADEEGSRWAVYWDPDGSLAQQTPVDRYVPIGLKRQLALGINSQYQVRLRGRGQRGGASPAPTPVTRSTLKNKSDDEENPTIQIPKVTPLASGLTLPPNLAELAENLEDKYIDEFGNVLEWDGRVLGRVEGDLPSMIGRPVSATGEVISTEGQVVGYVAENDTIAPRPPSPKPIHGMGEGMKLDHTGNILNRHNKIHSPTPVTRSTLKNKSDDEENPTIQIPKVTPLASGLTLPPNLAELAENLEDKYIDEFGNVLEWDGRVLGRVEGDLPSMIGRPVSATGEVISAEGQVVGYVAENDTISPRPPSPKPIHGMGEGMKLDHMGNILNRHNKIVGHLLNAEELVDAPEPIRRARNGGGGGSGGGSGGGGCGCNCGHGRAKPSAAPSPSEIYLDVKSTNDGVQLIIKIPTVFNGGGTPNIHIGTSS